MAKSLVGIFDEKDEAQRAVEGLRALGLQSDHVRMMNHSDSTRDNRTADTEGGGDDWMDKVGNWFATLFDDDDDRREADSYSEAYRRGNYIVVADVENNMVDRATAVLQKYGTVDINRRTEEWKATGYTGFDRSAQPYTDEERTRERKTHGSGGENVAIPVIQEELAVGKRVVQRGGVRVHSYVEERPVQEVVRLREERVNVQRRPVNRPATADELGFKERTVDVTAVGEEAVIGKTARVVEEVFVNKDVEQRSQTVKETVRRKDVNVENIGPSSAPASQR